MKQRAEASRLQEDSEDSINELVDRAPEYRMPLMQIGAAIVPAGLFIFAFTAREDVAWVASSLGPPYFPAVC